MNVYLHEIDIDEHGSEINLPCSIHEYLIKYIFFSDGVYLQSSSSLKRNDMITFFRSHPDFFSAQNDGGTPHISFVLDPKYESLLHYTDERMHILSTHANNQNMELSVYRENNAVQRAKELDLLIKEDDIKRRLHDVNIFYRSYLQSLEIPVIGEDIQKGINVINDYILHNDFIQTFDLMSKVDEVVANHESSEIIGKAVRNSYFRANAAAVNCDLHNRDWHLEYRYIHQYANAIGLSRLFQYNWKLDSNIVTIIKSFQSFHNLRSLYYTFNDPVRFLAFIANITKGQSSSQYYFHEKAYFIYLRKALKKDLDSLKHSVYHEERGV